VEVDKDVQRDVVNRLRRVQGQVNGLVTMIEEGRDCGEVVTQLAAATKALERAGFKILASGMRQCQAAVAEGRDPEMSQDELEKLFLTLG